MKEYSYEQKLIKVADYIDNKEYSEYHPKVTEKDIKDFEQEFDVKLPDDYAHFLMKYNSCTFDYCENTFYLSPKYYIQLSKLYALPELYPENKCVDIELLDKMFMIGITDVNLPIILSLREKDCNNIYYSEEEYSAYEEDLVFICNAFTNLINGLTLSFPEIEYLLIKERYSELKDKIEEKIKNNDLYELLEKECDNDSNKNFLGYLVYYFSIKSKYYQNYPNKSFEKDFEIIKYLIKLLFKLGAKKDPELIINSCLCFELIDFLISEGVDINGFIEKEYKGLSNVTSLMRLAASGIRAIVISKYLISKGADKEIRDKNGLRAYDYAVKAYKKEVGIQDKKQIEELMEILK